MKSLLTSSQRRPRTITSIINYTGRLRKSISFKYNTSATASSYTFQTQLRPLQIRTDLAFFVTI